MKSRILLPALIVALAGASFPMTSSSGRTPLPSDAQASRVVSRAVRNTPEGVLRYWTRERLRLAQPVELELEGWGPVLTPGAGVPDGRSIEIEPRAPDAVFGDQIPFDRFEITNPAADPYRKHGKVYFSSGGSNWVCSGTVVTSSSESLLVTAGHCVYDEETDQWSTNLIFKPAFKGPSSAPYGTWAATNLFTLNGWQAGQFEYDVGMARLGTNSGQTIQDVVGSRGISFNQPTLDTAFQAIGYPQAAPFDGSKMYECDSTVAYRDGTTAVAPMAIGCDMTGGSSGGGWVRDGSNVNSVVSYGYSNLPNVLFGPYFGSGVEGLYNAAGGGPSPTPTPTPTPSPTPTPTPTQPPIDTVAPSITFVSDKPDPFTPKAKKKKAKIYWTLGESVPYFFVGIYKGQNLIRTLVEDSLGEGAWYVPWNGRTDSGRLARGRTYTYLLYAEDASGNGRHVTGTTTMKR